MSGAAADSLPLRIGAGPGALLLPAPSSISTRDEMRPLAERLAGRFACHLVDWPGFGARPRGRQNLTPVLFDSFLEALLRDRLGAPLLGIAAGHGAGYLLRAAAVNPGRFDRLVLIAPTWRGPLPTMFDGRRTAVTRGFRRALEAPFVGPLLYRLNVSTPVVRHMMRAHVYADPARVQPALLAIKRHVTHQPNARFGTAAFVTGGLDPVSTRAEFLALLEAPGLPPILMLRPTSAPRRSGGEMDALAATARVQVRRIPGALAPHEEFPDAVAAAVLDEDPA